MSHSPTTWPKQLTHDRRRKPSTHRRMDLRDEDSCANKNEMQLDPMSRPVETASPNCSAPSAPGQILERHLAPDLSLLPARCVEGDQDLAYRELSLDRWSEPGTGACQCSNQRSQTLRRGAVQFPHSATAL